MQFPDSKLRSLRKTLNNFPSKSRVRPTRAATPPPPGRAPPSQRRDGARPHYAANFGNTACLEALIRALLRTEDTMSSRNNDSRGRQTSTECVKHWPRLADPWAMWNCVGSAASACYRREANNKGESPICGSRSPLSTHAHRCPNSCVRSSDFQRGDHSGWVRKVESTPTPPKTCWKHVRNFALFRGYLQKSWKSMVFLWFP